MMTTSAPSTYCGTQRRSTRHYVAISLGGAALFGLAALMASSSDAPAPYSISPHVQLASTDSPVTSDTTTKDTTGLISSTAKPTEASTTPTTSTAGVTGVTSDPTLTAVTTPKPTTTVGTATVGTTALPGDPTSGATSGGPAVSDLDPAMISGNLGIATPPPGTTTYIPSKHL